MTDTGPEDTLDVQQLDKFLDDFVANHRDDNFLSIKYGNYFVNHHEFAGEVVDWTIQYLQYMSCPASLEAGLTKAVLDEAKSSYLNKHGDQVDGEEENSSFISMNLVKSVTATVNEVCRRIRHDHQRVKPGKTRPHSVCAVKNGRRRMEDRHIVVHDLNNLFGDMNSQSDSNAEPLTSFYAVYDGHAGKDAAAYAASQLHARILESKSYPANPVAAIKEAFNRTDVAFLAKGELERGLSSGTTAVCSLIRGNTLYTGWLGDSAAVLVRRGKALTIVEPHKPNRPDEKVRIESLGGSVIHWGTWRVNGQLAVSRAIGDSDYKPYVSSDPDVTTVELNGSEDFLVIACDGLWDTVTPQEAADAVYKQLKENKDDLNAVAQTLVSLAKGNGSSDNITIIVVFLRPISELLIPEDQTDSKMEADELYDGVTSTSQFIHPNNGISNGDKEADAQPASTNPFASPHVENGKAENPFADAQGGSVFNPFQEGSKQMEDQLMGAEEQFKRASPSMFGAFEDSPAEMSAAPTDFMANQDASWIPSPSQPTNPFLKIDSGFISPANNSNHHSASSEGSAENDRNLEDEEEEGKEVSKLLSGGAIGDLILNANRETPTPPVEDTGSSLEEILAAAREQPDTFATEEVDDSDSSSVGSEEKAEEANIADVADSSDSEVEEGFSFVKSAEAEDQSTKPLEIENQLLEDDSVVKPPSIGHLDERVETHSASEDLVEVESKKEEIKEIPEREQSVEPDSPEIQEECENGQVPADSTLNALDDPTQTAADSSAPSSLDSQTGPASVIVESQEVPNPDQASFIIKPSGNQDIEILPTPQEAIVEVIPEPEVSQSPILEEEEVLSESDSDEELINHRDHFNENKAPVIPSSTIPASTIIPHEEMEAPVEATTVPTWQHVQSSPALIDREDQDSFVPTEHPIQEGTQDIINFSTRENDGENPSSTVSFEAHDVDDFMLKTPCVKNTLDETATVHESSESTHVLFEQPTDMMDKEHVIEPPITPTEPLFLTESNNEGPQKEENSLDFMQSEKVKDLEQTKDSSPQGTPALVAPETDKLVSESPYPDYTETESDTDDVPQQPVTEFETTSGALESVESSSCAETVPLDTPISEEEKANMKNLMNDTQTSETESGTESAALVGLDETVTTLETDESSTQESNVEAEEKINIDASAENPIEAVEDIQQEIAEYQVEVVEKIQQETAENQVKAVEEIQQQKAVVNVSRTPATDVKEETVVNEPVVVVSEAIATMDSVRGENNGLAAPDINVIPPSPTPFGLPAKEDKIIIEEKKESKTELEKSGNEEKITVAISKKVKDEKKAVSEEKMSVTAKKAPTTGATSRTKTPMKAPVTGRPSSRPTPSPAKTKTAGTKKIDTAARPSSADKSKIAPTTRPAPTTTKVAAAARPRPAVSKPNSAEARKPTPTTSSPSSRVAATTKVGNAPGTSRSSGTLTTRTSSTTRTSATAKATATTRPTTTRQAAGSKPTAARSGPTSTPGMKKPEDKKPMTRPTRPVPPSSKPPTSRPTSATTNGITRTAARSAPTRTLPAKPAKPEAPKATAGTTVGRSRPIATSARSTLSSRPNSRTTATGPKPAVAKTTTASKPPAPGSMAAKRAAAAAKAAASKEKKVTEAEPKEESGSINGAEGTLETPVNGSLGCSEVVSEANGHINGNDVAPTMEANGEA